MKRTFLKFMMMIAVCVGTAHVASAQSWPYLGSDSDISAGATYTSIVTADITIDGVSYVSVPHVAYVDNGAAKVKRFIDGAWQQVGTDITSASASYTYLFADDRGKLYINYVDGSTAGNKRLAIKTFNTTTNTWEALGGDNANLYLSSGSIIQTINNILSTAHNSWISFDKNNVPYVIFAEFATNSGRPVVKKFNGTAWEVVGSSPVSTDMATSLGICFEANGTTPYIVYEAGTGSTGNIKFLKFNGTAWEDIAVPAQVGGVASGQTTGSRHSNIIFDNDNNAYITYFNSGNANKATVLKYVPSTQIWSFSQAISSRDCPNITAIKAANGNLYISFTDLITDKSGRSVGRVFKLETGTTTWVELTNLDATVGIDEPIFYLAIAVGSNGNEYISYTKSGTAIIRVFSAAAPPTPAPAEPDEVVTTPKQMEYLTRGLVAARVNASQVLVSWRLLGTDASTISFNVYRNGVKLNSTPITTSTNYLDNTTTNSTYTIKDVINGNETKETSPVSAWTSTYLQIPLDPPAAGADYTYSPNDASVGDVDGDGEYEIFLKWDPSNSHDNSIAGYTGNVFIDCYKLNGTRLWRVDLGRNIRAGAHYTQFMVYDFDGDGKAEFACKTADATIDGTGVVIGDINADYRNSDGYILSGPEYLTMFNGLTGKAMSTVNYLPARGSVAAWGDSYGNRVDRFLGAVAYLDGAKPSLIMGRGYYTRLVRVAWDFVNGELKLRWIFDSNSVVNNTYAGQGNHQMSIADVDGDGKQEIINGSCAINDNGKGLWSSRKGHGDALHVTDMDPSRPGLEEWMCHEEQGNYTPYGLRLRDAKTGETLWGITTTGDIGRCMAGDIDPNYPGYEVWGSTGTYSINGTLISTNKPSQNFGIWWDGDLSRELLDDVKIDKWNSTSKSVNRLRTFTDLVPVASNNTTKATPCLSADILGDWREEVLLRSQDSKSLYLFTTPYITDKRIYTLMHDPQYRVAIAWQNCEYNQPPYPGFYLGNSMPTPPVPNIYSVNSASLPISLLKFNAVADGNKVKLNWTTVAEVNNKFFSVERSTDGKNFETVVNKDGAGNSNQVLMYAAEDYSPYAGKSYYRLKQTDFDGHFTYSDIKAVTILSGKTGLVISPNPATNHVELSLDSRSTSLEYSLVATDGTTIFKSKGSLSEANAKINNVLLLLSPGVYIFNLKDADKTYVQKLIKQ